MSRFALFHGDCYYANGGWDDFKGLYATVEEARAALDPNDTKSPSGGWAHIVDMETREVIDRAEIECEPPNYREHTATWGIDADGFRL